MSIDPQTLAILHATGRARARRAEQLARMEQGAAAPGDQGPPLGVQELDAVELLRAVGHQLGELSVWILHLTDGAADSGDSDASDPGT